MLKPHCILISTLCLSACAPTISDITAPIPIKKGFSISGSQAIPMQWWLALEDKPLTALIEQALHGNFTLKAMYQRLEQAKIESNQSGSELFPSLNAAFTGQQQYSNTGDSHPFSLGLTASYEVDLWGRIRANQQAAELSAKATEEELKTAALSLSYELAINWYRLIEQRSQLQLLNQQIQTHQDNVSLLYSRFAGAKSTAADLYQQQQILEASQGEKHSLIAAIQTQEHQLAILVGVMPKAQTFSSTAQLPDLSQQPLTGLTSDLIQRRPDLRAAYYQVQAANQRIASAIADRFPKLSLSANINTNSPNLQSLFNNWIATLAGNLILPIIDGGQRVAIVDKNKAKAKEALNQYAYALQIAIKEVEDALIQEQQQKKYLTSLNTQLQFSQQASKQIHTRYIYGSVDFLRVLSIQLSQQALERKQITAKRQLIEYRLKLYRALAGGWNLSPYLTPKNDTHE